MPSASLYVAVVISPHRPGGQRGAGKRSIYFLHSGIFCGGQYPVLAAGAAQLLVNKTLTAELVEQAVAAVDDDVEITGDSNMSEEMKRTLPDIT